MHLHLTADLHLTIHDEALDIFAVQETRVTPDAPDVIGKDLAPMGYRVINSRRREGHKDRGLAFIYRDHLNVKPIKSLLNPSTLEVLAVNIIIGTQRFIIANIYGFHGFGVLDFLDELSELEEILSAAVGHLILVGDYNCPGVSQDTIDVHLGTWLFCHIHAAINDGPTRIH